MTSIEYRVSLLRRRGVEATDMAPEEWLQLACQAEEFAKAVGPFDMAFGKFAQDAKNFFEAACVSELLSAKASDLSPAVAAE